uniref:Uncharacterized protein n=1 Tax=Anas platyrhynchos platyrhynchos TaxID=8840 RepID=A0A493TWL3_ANAPP
MRGHCLARRPAQRACSCATPGTAPASRGTAGTGSPRGSELGLLPAWGFCCGADVPRHPARVPLGELGGGFVKLHSQRAPASPAG